MPDTSPTDPRPRPVTVVGIGADGWSGLGDVARARIRDADVVVGSNRQLSLLPDDTSARPAARVTWPTPLLPALPGLLERHSGDAVCVLASGDPLFFGIGATLIRLLGAQRVEVIPHPSAMSLACARLGWAWSDVDVVTLVGRPVEHLNRVMQPGRRVLVLSSDGTSPAAVADLLTRKGYGPSELTVLENLGAADERVHHATAHSYGATTAAPLNVVAVSCRADAGTVALPLTPGLPDDAFEHDGQLTKRELRAITLAQLAPLPGQLLWDVGAGAGSIAIEWMRSHPSCRAIAIESRADRSDGVARNAAELGVPDLRIVTGRAPQALSGLAAPDAVFVGGGATVPGVIETCWDALAVGGRLVVNAVTIQTERTVADWYDKVGGDLIRVAVSRAAPVGGFTGWRPMLSVTQWTVRKQ